MPDAMSPDPEVAALAEALHEVMCDISHHDRDRRCSKWDRYPNIAASAVPRLHAAGYRVERDIRPLLQGEPHALPWEPLGLAAPTEEERQHDPR